ncbi:ig-like domain-containing protein [Clostridium sp. CAG:575]|nr:ig-like domain-containing protein [Clostridium sp. CAG:575]
MILSGVAIATLTGENGLFARAKQEKENYSISSAKEKLQLAISDLMVEQTSKGENLTKEYETSPVSILAETKFKRILAGYYHSLVIDEEGYLWTWGCNDYGALGDGTTENKKIPVKIIY